MMEVRKTAQTKSLEVEDLITYEETAARSTSLH